MSAAAPSLDFAAALRGYLERRGILCDRREVKILCYAHEDSKPSLRIDIERGLGFCDVCRLNGEGGGAVDIVMGLEGCDKARAREILHGAPTLLPKLKLPPAAPEPPRRADLDPVLQGYRAALDDPKAAEALAWLAEKWGVMRETLDRYEVGLGPFVRVPRRAIETFQLACPSYRAHALSGLKLYRPAWKDLGADGPKCVAEKGSKPGVVGATLLDSAHGRTVLVTGGEKDVLIAAAHVPELVAVAHAGGEGAWAPRARERAGEDPMAAIARTIADAPCNELVIALDVNERERGLKFASLALGRAAHGKTLRAVAWPEEFEKCYPKGGVAQVLLDRRWGADAFRDLLKRAPVVPPPPDDPPEDEGDDDKPKPRRPLIWVSVDVRKMREEAQEALNAPWIPERDRIYVHANTLTRVVPSSPGDPVRIEPLPEASLLELLSTHIRWMKMGKNDDSPALPPRPVVEALNSAGSWPFPIVKGVVSAPVFLGDGTVLSRKGYDPDSKLIFDPDGIYPAIPEAPVHQEVLRALATLNEPFADFPFVGESDRSAAIALVLTLLARPAIAAGPRPLPTPLFLIRATTPGSGKNLLANVASFIASGQQPTVMSPIRQEEEWRKQITTSVRSGADFIVFDEAEKLSLPALASALTQGSWTDRVLGGNELLDAPRPVFASCGNNTVVSGDIGRRLIAIDLDPGVERPEMRSGFAHPELEPWALKNRHRLVAAALTVLRGYAAAGSPKQDLSTFGSFEAWSGVVRSALVWAGLADPCGGRERVREESDSGLADARALFAAWLAFAGSDPVPAVDLVKSAVRSAEQGRDEDLRERATSLLRALAALAGAAEGERIPSGKLGYKLRKLRGRVVDGLRLDSTGRDEAQKTLWQVVRVDGPSERAVPCDQTVTAPHLMAQRPMDSNVSADRNMTLPPMRWDGVPQPETHVEKPRVETADGSVTHSARSDFASHGTERQDAFWRVSPDDDEERDEPEDFDP